MMDLLERLCLLRSRQQIPRGLADEQVQQLGIQQPRQRSPTQQQSSRKAGANNYQNASSTRQPMAEEDVYTNSPPHHNDLDAELKYEKRCLQSRSGLYEALSEEVLPQQPRGALSIRFKFYAHKIIGSGDVGVTDKELQPASSEPEQMTWVQVLHALLCYPPYHSQQQHAPRGISTTGDDDDFLNLFIAVLRRVPFPAFFFETTPLLGVEGLHLPFECVLIDAGDTFSRRGVSSQLFDEHLCSGSGTTTVKSFLNLGKDALLVVPCHVRGATTSAYGTLATFLRHAPGEQVRELWRVVAKLVLQEVIANSSLHLWVNTDGRAVPWLHLRIDTAPKYIKHQPYYYCPLGRSIGGSSQRANSSNDNSVMQNYRSPAAAVNATVDVIASYNQSPKDPRANKNSAHPGIAHQQVEPPRRCKPPSNIHGRTLSNERESAATNDVAAAVLATTTTHCHNSCSPNCDYSVGVVAPPSPSSAAGCHEFRVNSSQSGTRQSSEVPQETEKIHNITHPSCTPIEREYNGRQETEAAS